MSARNQLDSRNSAATRGRIAGLLLCLMVVGIEPVIAERYLTLGNAQKLCFPQADRFEPENVRLTPDQAKQIEQRTGVRLSQSTTRMWLARQDNKLIGVLVVDQVLGKHELIDYAVALAPSGKVLQVEVLEYRESHGDEIRARRWRSQFAGKTIASPLRLNQDIYNISGATISCRNLTDGIKRILAIYELVGRPRLLADGRLPGSERFD